MLCAFFWPNLTEMVVVKPVSTHIRLCRVFGVYTGVFSSNGVYNGACTSIPRLSTKALSQVFGSTFNWHAGCQSLLGRNKPADALTLSQPYQALTDMQNHTGEMDL